jgi:hypothetical protein
MEDSSQEQVEFREPTEQEKREMEQRYLDGLNDRRLLSIHEAGHGVVANHFDMGVVRVVVRSANRTSYTEIRKRPPSKETLHQDLVMALAGYFAVLKETGEEWIANIHCGYDNKLMFDLFAALSIGHEDQKEWMKEARPVAQQLVDTYWPAIKEIAHVLEAKGDVTEAEVRRIVDDCAAKLK